MTNILTSVREALKSKKLKLYEEYILDNKGQLKIYHPVVQAVLFSILEENGLEAELIAYDKELKRKDE